MRMRDFAAGEAAGGVALMIAAALAIILANLPATAAGYAHTIHAPVGPMTVHAWIGDGAMTVFFLLVGLEIRRELVGGRLASWDQRRLPFIAAAAGMVVPAVVYLAIVGDRGALRDGWAIPAATDIAFAMGVAALLGRRVPAALKLLLVTIAIVDDMGAVAIIAVAYTDRIDAAALAAAAGTIALLALLNRRGVRRLAVYLVLGVALWLFVLLSGVHATVAGVVLAALVPTETVERLEHRLHPWSAFVVVPLFAFANAGVSFAGTDLATPLVVAIAAGLFIGKQIGVLGGIALAVRFGLARRPAEIGWRQLHGLSLLAGIGFTMSLFIGDLAFPTQPLLAADVRMGVLIGSLLSALAGVAVLATAPASD